MTPNPFPLHPLPRSSTRKPRGGASSTRSRHRLVPPPDGNDKKRRLPSQTDSNLWKASKRRRVQLYKGMVDMPPEVVLMISTHLDDHTLRALALASRSFCRLLLPEYLRRCGPVMENAPGTSGSKVVVRDLSGYASLGLLSLLHDFKPPQEMSCSIPDAMLEARSAFTFLTRFLLNPSNTCNLRDFYLYLYDSNCAQLFSESFAIRQVFCTLPLTRLYLGGSISKVYPPPVSALRKGVSGGSQTLTAFRIYSDYAFAPGLVQTTMKILNHSPITSLSILVESLKARHWSTLLGELDMASLEDICFDGDIPQPPLIRFLAKHKRLMNICIRCDMPSTLSRPTRTQYLPFLPDLWFFSAPLAICYDIVERIGNSSNLYSLEIGMSRFGPHDANFRRLLEILASGNFQNLRYLKLELEPSSSSITSPASLNEHDWHEYPARDLTQIRKLGFSNPGQLSGDIDAMCAYVQSFPMVEEVCVTGVGDEFGTRLFHSLPACKATPPLRRVAIYLYSDRLLEWRGNVVH